MDVDNVADVSGTHTASIFKAEMSGTKYYMKTDSACSFDPGMEAAYISETSETLSKLTLYKQWSSE